MNANTRLRLWKEARALLPFWAAMAGLMVLPFLLRSQTPLHFSLCAYYFGCAMLGSVVIGQEFQHRTMGLLLSQPVSRRRLWWEKMSVLGAALLGLLLWLVVLGLSELDFVRSSFPPRDDGFGLVTVLLFPVLLGFCTGPVLTVLARGTIGGIALTFLCAWSVWLLGYLLLPFDTDGRPDVMALSILFLISFGLYPGALFLFGCRRFQHLEDIQGRGQELSLPAALIRPFAGFTERLTLNHGGVLGHLIRKEVRLHLPAFVVALGLVALWLALVVAVFARATMDKGFLMLPIVLLCLGIPVIAGIVSTAEERSLGLLDWHLTLPVSARRQWFVKVLVAFGVNVVLGILLPGVLGQASSWLAADKQMVAGIPGEGVPHFLIANLVIFCAALYASTAAANSMRALVGTIVLFIAVPVLFFPLLNYLGRFQPNFSLLILPSSQVLVKIVPTGLFPELLAITVYGGIIFAMVWLFALGMANFRRSLDSFWRPVRQMTGFFAAVALLLFALTILGRSMDYLRSNGWNF